jgi:REP element-mobilizing transposase RayT
MPRQPREKSESGIYHIMLRGINQQVIFEDYEDYSKFIETLETYKAVSEYKVFAYCLMSNHIHILLKVEKEDLDLIMKRIAGSYVYWYNWKYYRKGHLFQDRFKSEPVESDAYLLTVIRYVHWNPVKVGLCSVPEAYPYSSYARYFEPQGMIDSSFIAGMMGVEEFRSFHSMPGKEECLDVRESTRQHVTDEQAVALMRSLTGCKNASEYQSLTAEKRDKGLGELLRHGVSIRQASRITGISFGIVRKFVTRQ